MKIISILLVSVVAFFCLPSIEAQKRPIVRQQRLDARTIAARILPSIVLIITSDENGKPIAQGSGFLYASGLVVSNLHVFKRATNALVKNVKTGNSSRILQVVGMNAKDDICIVQIENKDFPSLSLGDSNSVQTGDEIYVASNPEGLEGSITKGIISSVRAEVGLFQIDAAISPGSSGGVLVNTKGQAVGIVSSSLIGGQNLNFAIPINKLKKIPLKYRHTIQLAGACAYTDLEKERLKGPVKSVESRGYPKARESNRIISNELITLGIETYDREGILIESEIHDGTNGRLAVTQKFFYDENRIKTSLREESTLNGKVGEMRFDFDDGIYNKLYGKGFSGSAGRLDGQGGMKVYNSNGDVTAWYFRGVKYTYEYNDDGRVLTQTQSRDGVEEIITRFSYKDDKYGNWIEKFGAKRYPNTQGVNPGQWFPIETEYRNIVYYGQE